MTAEQIIELCRTGLGSYKKPSRVEFTRDPLPKSVVGKLQRKALRERHWRGKERRVAARWLCSVSTAHERAGSVLEEGQLVYLAIAGANRDPAEFSDPDRLDVRRAPPPHLGFGAGPHFCLGASLARLEAEVALRTLVERCADLEVTGELRWDPVIVARSLSELPVAVRPAPGR